jgi:hypothetical protein
VPSPDKLQLHLEWDDPYGGTGLDEVNTAAAAAAAAAAADVVGLLCLLCIVIMTATAVPWYACALHGTAALNLTAHQLLGL